MAIMFYSAHLYVDVTKYKKTYDITTNNLDCIVFIKWTIIRYFVYVPECTTAISYIVKLTPVP